MMRPSSLDEAVTLRDAFPDAMVLAGGTDLMVGVNFGTVRPSRVLSLRNVQELKTWRQDAEGLWIGAGVTHWAIERELAPIVPALARAARTVGSPPIRAQGTIGGNLGTASPAGDTLPVLVALDALVHVVALSGSRVIPISEFFLGPKRSQLRQHELIEGVHIPAIPGFQDFIKVGTRNAMVIAIASICTVIDRVRREVRCGLGSVGPTPIRPRGAEEELNARIDWETMSAPQVALEEFVEQVAASCAPISDLRASADYRRHCIRVITRRALGRGLR
jgi:CO/xanthine dehydrogenase FAD-binding subunit